LTSALSEPTGVTPEVLTIRGQANSFSQASHLNAIGADRDRAFFLSYLAVAATIQLTVSVTKVEWLSAPAVPVIVMV
jgi:hypothetical protein